MAGSAKEPKESSDSAESNEGRVSVELGNERSDAAASPQQPQQQRGALTRFDEFERDMERIFDSFMSRNWLRPFRDFPTLRSGFEMMRGPRIDLVERDDEVVLRAELPGVDKNDLHVSLTDRTVTIRATTRKEEKEEKGEYYRREISTGEMSRTLTLPCEVDGQNTRAEFKDGILEIVAPKVAKSKRVQIDVK